MNKKNSRETTLENICTELRKKSVSELLAEQEVIWRSENLDPNLLLAYDKVLEEKGHGLPDVDVEKELELFKMAHPQFFRAKSTETANNGPQHKAQHTYKRNLTKYLRMVPAVIILVTVLLIMANALGIPQWVVEVTDGAYSLINTTGQVALPQSVDAQFHSLQEALDAHGIVDKVAPTWIPTGYSFDSAKVLPGESITIVAKYLSQENDGFINITITPDKTVKAWTESDENQPIEEYPYNDIIYRIAPNLDQYTAYWETEKCACRISGDITHRELKAMIISISKE